MRIVKSQSAYKYFLFMMMAFAIFVWTPRGFGEVLYLDDFEDGKIDGKYEFKNHEGDWIEKGGVISQTHESPGDHTYLVLDGSFPEPHTGLVMIRVDDWGDGDLARCGLGFRLDPGDASGYVFLIHRLHIFRRPIHYCCRRRIPNPQEDLSRIEGAYYSNRNSLADFLYITNQRRLNHDTKG